MIGTLNTTTQELFPQAQLTLHLVQIRLPQNTGSSGVAVLELESAMNISTLSSLTRALERERAW